MSVLNEDNYRYELKFLLTEKKAEILKYRLSLIMNKDTYSVNPNGEYYIRSLYFDDVFNTAYYEKLNGVYEREKFRIRYYNFDDSFITLELKGKKGNLSYKKRDIISKDEYLLINSGNYDMINTENRDVLKKFINTIKKKNIKPSVIVDYKRIAYTYSYEDVRITFDENIMSGKYNYDLLLSLLIAVIGALIIDFTYKKTYIGVSYAKSNSLSIILLALVTSIVIRAINSNLSLSLGMVGALSIVRFRTAIKDPVDTIFMFWAITVGIMSGAGLYIVTILSTIIISVIYFISYVFQVKRTKKMLLIVVCTIEKSKEIIKLLDNKKCLLKTEMYKDNMAELTFEISDRKEKEKVIDMTCNDEIKSINVIDID